MDWQGLPFSQLDVLPKNHHPVTTWTNQDQAFQEIAIQKARPKKVTVTVKFGMELAIESGQLTAVIVKGSGKANLEITLEWERSDKVES